MICDLCASEQNVTQYQVKPRDEYVNLCQTCKEQIQSDNLDEAHFNCLNDAMWSEKPAVKVLSYRLLKKLGRNDLLDMMYLEDDEKTWAEYEEEVLKDSNGNILQDGDNVTVIKDLEVKGANKTIKRGTTVKNIRMCDTPGHVSCKVDGIGSVYLKVEFLKKI
ncbi:MAG: PhnA protein [Epsilonproteobacteria bacterium]|nr:PhnA protein [Campylobacterota bacterium]